MVLLEIRFLKIIHVDSEDMAGARSGTYPLHCRCSKTSALRLHTRDRWSERKDTRRWRICWGWSEGYCKGETRRCWYDFLLSLYLLSLFLFLLSWEFNGNHIKSDQDLLMVNMKQKPKMSQSEGRVDGWRMGPRLTQRVVYFLANSEMHVHPNDG